jgi:hypothetical protein
MTDSVEQTFAITCLMGFIIFVSIKLMIQTMLREERVDTTIEQIQERLKLTLTEAAAAAQQEEFQEDIRILKDRIDSVCEADIKPLKHEIRMLFDHILLTDGYPSRRDLLTYIQKKKSE